MKPKFQFSTVVVVNGDQIGLIVKTWAPSIRNKFYTYEVYVRSANSVLEYDEHEIKHYVFSKELSEDEKEFY